MPTLDFAGIISLSEERVNTLLTADVKNYLTVYVCYRVQNSKYLWCKYMQNVQTMTITKNFQNKKNYDAKISLQYISMKRITI